MAASPTNTRLRLLRPDLLLLVLLLASCWLSFVVQASSSSITSSGGIDLPPPHRPPPPGAGVVQQKRERYVPPPPLRPKQAEEEPTRTKLPPPPPKRTATVSSTATSTPPQIQSIPEPQKKVLCLPPPITPTQKTTNDALLDRFASKHGSTSSTTVKEAVAASRDPLLERFNKIVGDTKQQPTVFANNVPAAISESKLVEKKEASKEPPFVDEKGVSRKVQVEDENDDDDEEILLLGEAASVPPPSERMEYLYHQTPPVRQSPTAMPLRPPLVVGMQEHVEEVPRQHQQQQVVPPKVTPPPQQQSTFQQQRVPPLQQQQRHPSQQQQEARQQYYPPQNNQQQQQQYRPPQNQQQQQWVQQQQRRQPPPTSNRRQPPSQRAASTKTPLLLKSLWQRVEQGLDSLANVEDIVADRASQLTNSVTHRARDLTTLLTQSRDPQPSQNAHPPRTVNQRSAAPVQPQRSAGPAPAGNFGAAKTVQLASNTGGASSAPPPSAHKMPASLANLYSGSFSTPENDDSDDEGDEGAATPARRKSSWDDVMGANKNRAIRAGSSNPDYSTTSGAVAGDTNNNLYGRKESPFMQLQQQHRQGGRGNPPPRNNNLNPPAGAAGPPTVQRPFAAARSGPQQQQAQATIRPSVSYEDLSTKPSLVSRIGGMVPSLPRMPSVMSKLLGRGSGSYREMAAATLDVWKDDEQSARVFSARRLRASSRAAGRQGQEPTSATPPLTDLLSRCHHGKSTSLLSSQELRHCKLIANTRAVLDVGVLALVVLGANQIICVSEVISFKSIDGAVATLVSNLASASRGWGYFALVAAFLTAGTNFVLFEGQIHGMATSVSNSVRGASQYAQLYMRLVAGQPVDKHVPERMQQAARAQTLDHIQIIRMQTFVTIVLASMLVMTVSVVQPILLSIIAGLYHIVTLPELWVWPVVWSNLGSAFIEISHSVMEVIKDLLAEQFSTYKDNPLAMVFQLSIVAALLLAAFLPIVEHSRRVRPLDVMDEEDEDVTASAFGTVTTLSNLGVSSASRLGLLSKSGALEGTLERWRATLPPLSTLRDVRSFSSSLRRVGYTMVSSLALASPVMVYFQCFHGVCLSRNPSNGISGFDSIWNVSIMLLFVLRSSWKSISSTVESSNLRPYVQSFVKGLGDVVDEVSGNKQEGLQMQLGSSMSATIGLGIKDLWAAHTSKRAWAVRGATFDCQNGEVVAILGDDGNGKSRILTAISEVLVNPSKRSLTTTKVRGTVSIGGLDATKWDRDQLKKRLGLFLNDVRTIADNAEFMSGFTLEEILEPMDGLLNKNPAAGARAVTQALQISGLSTTLIPRLPGKLSTVVTANENELTPSELRPRCYALSPSEWAKLLLTRVLAQTIFDNENVSNAPLVGSLLLLDDLTTHLSEEEELKIMQTLRKTGAATVFTSHKWASGRLADRIVIIKDGAVVESGTHNELLARGPQQSMYAAKWHTMTTG